MNFEHPRVTSKQLGVARRSAEHLGPVESEIPYVRRIEAMREGMADLGLLEAALVMCRRECEEGGVAAGDLVNGWSCHGQ